MDSDLQVASLLGNRNWRKSLQGSGISCPWVLVSGTPTDPVTSAWFPGVCAVNGLLYVVGGDDGSCNLASVEYYNPVTDKWTLLPANMSTGRSYAGQWGPVPGTTTPRAGRAWGMSWLSREWSTSCRVAGNFIFTVCPG